MSWFKEFKLDWFGKKKYDSLIKEIQELKKVITEEKASTKPYKKAYYANGIITIVLYSGDVLSKVCDITLAKQLDTFNTEFEIIEAYSDKPVLAVSSEFNMDEKEKMAKDLFSIHSDEVLDILGDQFDEKNGEFFYKGVNLAIPTILLNAMVETKRQGMDNQFNSFKNFWLWTSLNPVESSRNDLFTFIRKNDVKLTGTGLLVLYRRIVGRQNKKNSKTLEDFISQQYFGIKKNKKSPKSYTILQEPNGNYRRVNIGKESIFPTSLIIGNLHTIYKNLADVIDNVYTDSHTGTKKIQIGTIYREDESKIDLDNTVDCSTGLTM